MNGKSFGFTLDRTGTVVIFQSMADYGIAKTANPDLKLITIIGNDDLQNLQEIVITQICEQEDKTVHGHDPT